MADNCNKMRRLPFRQDAGRQAEGLQAQMVCVRSLGGLTQNKQQNTIKGDIKASKEQPSAKSPVLPWRGNS